MIDLITNNIKEAIPDSNVVVLNPMNDGVHFQAHVAAESFRGLPLVKQHRLVMNSLKEEFKELVHALALKTYLPEAWEEQKTKLNL